MNLRSLATVSRNLASLLDSGVPTIKSVRLAGRKAADPGLRRAMAQVADDVASGTTLTEAIEETNAFPDLFVDLVSTGEETGNSVEVLRSLADHYDRLVQLRRDFRQQITMPVIQFVAAVLIVAGLIVLLGWIAQAGGNESWDILGFGLTGTTGALLFLGYVAGFIVGAIALYKFLTHSLPTAKVVHRSLLFVPVVGSCMRKFALARFSWGYHLTQESGLPIKPSIEASVRATSNGAFIDAGPGIVERVYDGQPLSDALEPTGLFPPDYIELVHVGETTGTVPETLHRVGPQLEEDARRSLKTLASAAGWAVWVCVAVFIIYVIFRIAFLYLNMVNEFL